MATGVTVPADSQPAQSSSERLASMSEAETIKWRTTGELPEDKPAKDSKATTTDGDSSTPAKTETPEAPAKATETAAGSVPAPKEPGKSQAKGAPERIQELLSENKQLKAKLDELSKAPAPAAKKEEASAKPQRTDVDPKTGQVLYANDEAFEQAREEWLTKKITADVQKQTAKAAEEARIAEQNKLIEQRWTNSIKIAEQKHPDFAQILKRDDKGAFQGPEVKAIKNGSVLDAWILDSEMGAEILYYVESNPGEVARIQNLNAFQAARELTRLEEKLSTAPSTPPKKSEETPPTKKVSSAPAPAADVSGKNTAPVDSIGAALTKGNFHAYQTEANAEDYARKKKRA